MKYGMKNIIKYVYIYSLINNEKIIQNGMIEWKE